MPQGSHAVCDQHQQYQHQRYQHQQRPSAQQQIRSIDGGSDRYHHGEFPRMLVPVPAQFYVLSPCDTPYRIGGMDANRTKSVVIR